MEDLIGSLNTLIMFRCEASQWTILLNLNEKYFYSIYSISPTHSHIYKLYTKSAIVLSSKFPYLNFWKVNHLLCFLLSCLSSKYNVLFILISIKSTINIIILVSVKIIWLLTIFIFLLLFWIKLLSIKVKIHSTHSISEIDNRKKKLITS